MINNILNNNNKDRQLGDILVQNSEDFNLERNKKQVDFFKKIIEEAIFNKKFNNDGVLEFHTTIDPHDLLKGDHTDFQQWLADEKLEIYDHKYVYPHYYWKVKPLTSNDDSKIEQRNLIATSLLIGCTVGFGSWFLYFATVTNRMLGFLMCVVYSILATWVYFTIDD